MQTNIEEMKTALQKTGYIAADELVTALTLMERLKRPLLIEGEAGVGKTAIAAALAKIHDCKLIRLQCYEGLDSQSAVYEWNYSKQLLWINLQEKQKSKFDQQFDHVFGQEFLLERPLLQAIRQESSPVLLIDEIDRADEAFEAFLLELLSEYQITIPEFGTVTARSLPRVILTSNSTRELSDALRRRCLYYYMDYPDREREYLIIEQSVPNIDEKLNHQIVDFIQTLRKQDLRKRPGIAETLDWAAALMGMGVNDLLESRDMIAKTLSCLLKTQDDMEQINPVMLQQLLDASA